MGRYYLDFSSKANYPGKFSVEGIPLYSYLGRPYIEHPTVVAQYAFGLYELLYRRDFKDEKLRSEFLRMAKWFERNQANVKGGKGWYVRVEQPEYNLNDPWISAMVQGQAISVLTRAAQLTGNSNFEQLADEALSPFEYDVKDGGLVNYFDSIPIYEEFPTLGKTMGVLNGFIFSLFGLFDLILLSTNKKALKLFIEGTNSLKRVLPYYDLNYWSRYYLFDYPKKYFSSYTYHVLVSEQLKAIFFLTGENIFMDYSQKWISYTKSFLKKNLVLFRKLIYANKLIP
jgi:hypothetical protein